MEGGHPVNQSSTYWLSDYDIGHASLRWPVRAFSFAIFFVGWELVGRSEQFFAIAPASETFDALWTDLGQIWSAILGTLRVAAAGFLPAAVIGILAGTLIGTTRMGREALDPLVNVGVVAPMTMLVPVLGIYIGLGYRGKVALVLLFSVFVIVINTAAGVAETPPALRETAASFGIRGFALYRKVILPGALPYVLTGLRLGAGRAVQGAIIADLLLEVSNIGLYLIRAGSTFDMPSLLAGTLFTVAVASTVMLLVRSAERRALRWLQT